MKIKKNGSVEILSINIGYSPDNVKSLLGSVVIENQSCLYLKEYKCSSFPIPVTIFFYKKHGIISSMSICCNTVNFNKAEVYFNNLIRLFKSHKESINIIEDKTITENGELYIFSSEFLTVKLNKGRFEKSSCYVNLIITCDVLNKIVDKDWENESIRMITNAYLKAYWAPEYTMIDNESIRFKELKSNNLYRLVKLFIFTLFLLLLSFYVYNNYKSSRYFVNTQRGMIIDKWSGKVTNFQN